MKNQTFIKSLFILAICFLCNTAFSQTEFLQRSGKLSFLLVHPGSGYGPSSDHIDTEVVIKLNNYSGAYGFQLRNDNNKISRSAMLDLLRDAFTHNHTVVIDFDLRRGKKNGIIKTVMVKK